MALFIRKYLWTINLVTISLCALLAAKAVGRVVEARLAPVQVQRLRSGPPAGLGQAMLGAQSRDITPILSRNIFCSTCQPAKPVAVSEPGADPAAQTGDPSSDAPIKTSLNLKLIATLVSDEDKAWSFAAIQDTSSEKSRIFAIGTKVPGDAVVTDILDRRVMLLNGGRNEYLALGEEADPSSSSITESRPRPVVNIRSRRGRKMPGMEEISKGIRKTAAGKYEIDRSALNKVLANTTLLARSARIVPSVRNGKPSGFKLYAIRPGSVYSLLGMHNGDTINAINGHPITTPDKALEVYTKLRSASHVAISFTRRGKATTHEYTIR